MEAFVLALGIVAAFVVAIVAFGGRGGRDRSGPAPKAHPELRRTPAPPPPRTGPQRTDHRSAPKVPAIPASREIRGRAWVIDGDTIVIGKTHIRLAGIDAPELDMPWGQKSKWAMVAICKGRTITAKLTGEVSHDRLVAKCYLPDGRDIGAELVKQGLALDWPLFSGGCYRHLEPAGVRRKLHGCGHFGRPKAMPQSSQVS